MARHRVHLALERASAQEAQAASVKSLQQLYTVVVGMALTQAILALFNARGRGRIDPGLLPLTIAFFVTLVPVYHGSIRHLDNVYIERRPERVRARLLLGDFAFLFFEACLLVALAALLSAPRAFVLVLATLFLVDAAGAFLFTLTSTESTAEWQWAVINGAAGVVLLVAGVLALPDETLRIGTAVVAAVRTALDYTICWECYYPEPR